MNSRKVTTVLNRIGRRVNFLFPNINHGGCCVFAAIIGTELKRLGISARGIVASYYSDVGKSNIDSARENVSENIPWEWEESGVYFTHVGVEYDINGTVKHYDSNGVKRKGSRLLYLKIYDGRLTVDELKELSRTSKGWNPSFVRKDIPAMRRLIKEEMAALA